MFGHTVITKTIESTGVKLILECHILFLLTKKPLFTGVCGGVFSVIFVIDPWVILRVLDGVLSWHLRRLYEF